MTDIRTIAVAGATGRLGRHVVEILEAGGHQVVPMSRKNGVDVITQEGLAEALSGAQLVIDCSTGPSPEEAAATEFFTTATQNLHTVGAAAGVQRLVVVSIIGCDRFTAGYNVSKVAHERAALAGPLPARILRAAQFHEFVPQLLDWGTQNGVAFVPTMRTQLVAAETVAERLVELALAPDSRGGIPEVAGPRVERLVEMAQLVADTRGRPERVEEHADPSDPDYDRFATDGLLPGPDAILAGPTFAEWLAATHD